MSEDTRRDEQMNEIAETEYQEPAEDEGETEGQETEGQQERQAEQSRKKREWLVLGIFLLLVVAAYFAYQVGYENVEQETRLRECKKIEQQIATSPAFQQANVTCNCAPGDQYFDEIQKKTPDKVVKKANLRYVVSCNMDGNQKLYPVWRADGAPKTS